MSTPSSSLPVAMFIERAVAAEPSFRRIFMSLTMLSNSQHSTEGCPFSSTTKAVTREVCGSGSPENYVRKERQKQSALPPEKNLVARHKPSSSLTVGFPKATDVSRGSKIGIENFILMILIDGSLGDIVK